MGGKRINHKDMMKISKNVMFDRGSFEDLKCFSNNLNDENYNNPGGYTAFNKYKSLDRKR
jgi:hypothetical protein